MAPRYLLDTNICIFIRQNRPPSVTRRFQALASGEAAISVITYGELAYGAEKSLSRKLSLKRLAQLVTFLPVLPLPEKCGETYGRIRVSLERRGEMIGNNDLWIAAHALAIDLVLVTNNEGEFRRVPGLKIENWAAS
jgi:tRNA(fMet)-specific endonuclease VapC